MSSDGVEWQALPSMVDPNRTKLGFCSVGGGGALLLAAGRVVQALP